MLVTVKIGPTADGISCNSVWCRVSTVSGRSLAVGSFYRPPSTDADPLFSLGNALASTAAEDVVLGEDFKLPDMKWSSDLPITTNSFPVCVASLYVAI